MAKHEKRHESSKGGEGSGEAAAPNPAVVEKGRKIKEEMDKLLDEIDDVLEENAEEFVKNYVQKGGE